MPFLTQSVLRTRHDRPRSSAMGSASATACTSPMALVVENSSPLQLMFLCERTLSCERDALKRRLKVRIQSSAIEE